MRVRILSVVPAAALAVIFAAQVRADTLYTNLDPPGTPYNQWWIVGNTGSGTQVDAFPFSPTQTGVLTGADLPLAGSNGSNGSVATPVSPLTVYIESDTASGQPGSILDTLTQSEPYFSYPTTTVVNFTCSGVCTTLDAGTTYWIVGQQTVAANATYWLYNGGATGTWYFNDTNGATGPWTVASTANGNTFGNFDVTGNAVTPVVPEPASLALLGSGLVLVGFLEARRRAWLTKHKEG